MESAPVILLVEYLRMYPDQGVTLYSSGHALGLRFDPGIRREELKGERGRIACNLAGLLQDAATDLRALIARGIEVPLLFRDSDTAPPPDPGQDGGSFRKPRTRTDRRTPKIRYM